MSDHEKETRGGKTSSSGRTSLALLTVPSAQTIDPKASTSTDGRPSRSSSPARLSTELYLKVKTQISRVDTLKKILASIPDAQTEVPHESLAVWTSQVDQIHKAFMKKHAYFEVSWPSALVDHEYFEDDVHQEATQLVLKAKLLLSRHKKVISSARSVTTSSSGDDIRLQSKLPDITLPSFSGEYLKWPAFRELFSSLILNNERLSSVEKLHYLRGCMKGSPAQLIQSLPLTEESLEVSWDLLISRYESKRLLIQAHLDKLFGITTPTARDAASLTKLISTVSEANKALQSLGMEQNMWDYILVHHVSKHLDRLTREQWETSLGASQEYPRFQQLEAFLTSRARALERIEATPQSTSSTKTNGKKALTAQPGATQQTSTTSKSTAYACDCCKANHFVVMCPKFRQLSVSDRRKLVVEKWLCFNCLGRHNVRSCKSSQVCKHCLTRHHTMFHEAQPTSVATTKTTGNSSTPHSTQ